MARTKQTRRYVPKHVGREKSVLDETVLCIFFSSEWLFDLDLCQLDSAICHKDIRQLFLNFIAADNVCLTGFDCGDPEFEDYFRWLDLRQLKVRQIVLDNISRVHKSEKDVDLESLAFHVDLTVQRSVKTLKVFSSRSGHNIVSNSTLNDLLDCQCIEQIVLEIEEPSDLTANCSLVIKHNESALFPKLQGMRIQNVPSSFVTQLIRGSVHLRNICIEGDFGGVVGDSLSNEVIHTIGNTSFLNLNQLTLRPSNFELPNHDVYCQLAAVCTNLTMFTLHSSGLSDDRVKVILRQCGNLTHLELFNAYNITNNTVQNIATYCPKVKHLNIGGPSELTCDSLRYVLKHCKDLVYLNVMLLRVSHDTLTWISNIAEEIKLETLVVGNCNPDEDEWIQFMQQVATNLKVVKCVLGG
jgi:hypothetical protein